MTQEEAYCADMMCNSINIHTQTDKLQFDKYRHNFEKRVKKCLKLLKGKRRIISVWRFRFSCVPRNAGSRFRRGQCRLASREPALREVRLLGDGMPWRVVARLSGPDEMVFFTMHKSSTAFWRTGCIG